MNNTPFRDTREFIDSAFRAACQNANTSARARRAQLDNVGRKPCKLRQRVFAAVELAS